MKNSFAVTLAVTFASVASVAACKKNETMPQERVTAINGATLPVAEPSSTRTRGTETKLPSEHTEGALEAVATFDAAMPTGVSVSQKGRVFVNFPRWGDQVDFTVGEVREGKVVAYPNEAINRQPTGKLEEGFVSVQSVVVDPKDRLWVLDTGAPKLGPTSLGGPKLVGIDLATNAVFKTIVFPRNVALATSYLNDVRFDLRRGADGMAFITDSSKDGTNGIVVVDLASGRSWRKLEGHPSTKAEKGFLPFVEGRALTMREPGKPYGNLSLGSDGIAISNDGKLLYYCPLASRRLYAVATDALADEAASTTQVAATVKDLGEKGASDGLESDAEGRVYATNYEANAITRRNLDGTFETIVADPRALWPDTMSLATDGFLYFTANQLHRQASYHDGRDLREKPYALYRVRVSAHPVLLK